MGVITQEMRTLMCIYNSKGTRLGLIERLEEIKKCLMDDEVELRKLTDKSLKELYAMSDERYESLELYLDFSKIVDIK